MQRVNSNKIKKDNMTQEEERVELLIAIGLTQVFDCIVTNKVAYSYIAASKSLLVLQSRPARPTDALLPSLCPGEDEGKPSDGD